MKMQRSTAIKLYLAIKKLLDDSKADIIVLPDSIEALIKDALARDELSSSIDEASGD